MIQLEELEKFLINDYVVFASSSKENKQFLCKFDGSYIVKVAHDIVYMGFEKQAAIDKYNSITDKWIKPKNTFRI